MLMKEIREDLNKQRDILSSKTGKVNIVNISIFPRLISYFQQDFFVDLYGKAKKVEYKTTEEKKNKVEDSHYLISRPIIKLQ